VRTLTPEGWREASPYLDQVLSLPKDERAPWLESFRAGETRPGRSPSSLQHLLQEHRALAHQQFLERSPVSGTVESSLTGQKIGAYTLVSPIGQGGMGSVWPAERSDGRFDRRVAVTFLNFSVAATGICLYTNKHQMLVIIRNAISYSSSRPPHPPIFSAYHACAGSVVGIERQRS
jgi:hypothetical protein